MIRLTKLALQRPVTVILCLVTIAYFGFQSLIGARMELIPEMELPMLLISTIYAGAAPDDVEELITTKEEDAQALEQYAGKPPTQLSVKRQIKLEAPPGKTLRVEGQEEIIQLLQDLIESQACAKKPGMADIHLPVQLFSGRRHDRKYLPGGRIFRKYNSSCFPPGQGWVR